MTTYQFITSDGYTLTLVGDVWTDGDLEFDNRMLQPVDCHGEPLDGRLVCHGPNVTHRPSRPTMSLRHLRHGTTVTHQGERAHD